MTEEEYKKALLNINRHGIYVDNLEIMNNKEEVIIKKYVQKLCNELKPKRILEVGYGSGFTAEVLKAYAEYHVVVEIHPVLAQMARDNGYNVIERSIHDVVIDEEFDLIWDDKTEVTDRKDIYSYKEIIKHKHFKHFGLCE